MRRIVLLLMGICFFGVIYAQVGINTTDPNGIFHIDGKGNNNGAGTKYYDDLIVDDEGNLGLGRRSTGAKVDILSSENTKLIPGFRLEDGNEAEGRVLTSDNNGFATWKSYREQERGILGKFSNSPLAICCNPAFSGQVGSYWIDKRPGDTFVKTGGEITLTPGKWMVKVTCLFSLYANPISGLTWARFILADDESITNPVNAAQRSKDLVYASSMINDLLWLDQDIAGVLSGYFLLDNKGSVPKTYYLVCGWIALMESPYVSDTVFLVGGDTSENVIYATNIG